MSSTFRELLRVTSETVERPKALADGHYIGEIVSYEFGTSSKKQTPYVMFNIKPLEETSDVVEGANEGINFDTKVVNSDKYYITPKSVYRLVDVVDAVLGPDPKTYVDDRLPDTRGVRVLFEVRSRVDENDDTRVYTDIPTIVAYQG